MPKAASFSPLRLISPIQLLFCFVLFFLPWTELVVLPKVILKDAPKEVLQAMEKKTGKDPLAPRSMFSQSGLQIATAGYTITDPDVKKSTDKLDDDAPLGKEKDKYKAPFLFAYLLFLLAGIVVAFIPIPTVARRCAVAGCCVLALLVVAGHAAAGFPVEREIKKEFDKRKEEIKKAAEAAGRKGEMELPYRFSFSVPLYLTFLLLLGATGTAFLDGAPAGGGKGRYGRKGRRDYDTDDDFYEEDEDDRSRKRSRRDDDYDDEDDRPRKKKPAEPLSLDDDEPPPPPPKKKPRRDDYDEDDRPRKKKKDDDDFPLPGSAAPSPPPAAPAAPAGPNPFAFDDEPPPSKKKPRRRDDDDDDYDDRPRKKRRRDDDDY